MVRKISDVLTQLKSSRKRKESSLKKELFEIYMKPGWTPLKGRTKVPILHEIERDNYDIKVLFSFSEKKERKPARTRNRGKISKTVAGHLMPKPLLYDRYVKEIANKVPAEEKEEE